MTTKSIGDAARETGVPAWRLRSWEQRGFLSPHRAENGYRVFDAQDLARIRELEDQRQAGQRLQGFTAAPTGPRQTPAQIGDSRRSGNSWRHLMHVLRKATEPREVYEAGLDALLGAVGATMGDIAVADTVRHEFITIASRGLGESFLDKAEHWQLHEGLAGRAYGLRQPVVARDLEDHVGASRVALWDDSLRGYLCVPLLSGASRIGMVEVFMSTPHDFTAQDIDIAEDYATFLAAYIESRKTTAKLDALRAERSSFTRRWTSQWSLATQAERERIGAALDFVSSSLESTSVGVPQAAALVQSLSEGVRSSDRALFDGASLIQAQIESHLTDESSGAVNVQFANWPEFLPIEYATRHAFLVGQIVRVARASTTGPIEVSATSDAERLTIEVVLSPNDRVDLLELTTADETIQRALRDLGGLLREHNVQNGHGVIFALVRPSISPLLDRLSPRERQVLDELDTAKPNAQLAAQLGISVKTLQNHLTSIYRKLEVTDRVEAVARLFEPGAR